jgi:two-component system phosphate regulon sensor histidine kinase PhoR
MNMRASLRSRLFFSFFLVMVIALTVPAHSGDLFRNGFVMLSAALILALALAFALSMLLARRIEAPIRDMADMIGRIATSERHRVRLHPSPGGAFAQLADAVNDMAERMDLSIAAVEAQKARLETILGVMEEGVLVLGAQGRIRMANDTLARLFPLVADAEGRRPIEVIPSAELQEAVDALLAPSHAGAAGMKFQIEPRRDLILSVQIVRPSIARHAVEAVAVFHNVTELVRLMRVRRDFTANISHELRTPLTSIQGYAETMAELAPEDEPMRARCLAAIRRQAAQMSRLVEDLLMLTRLQSSSLPLDPRNMKLADLARRVAGIVEAQAEAKHLDIRINIPEDICIHADEHYLSQVLRNLLENACRHAPADTAVEISSLRAKDVCVTSVCDQGSGIPTRALERVFERFYQVESGRGHSGLGLAICKHIVERHGGRIWAENTPESAILFSLPITDAQGQPETPRA